jgi:hypothetical protein
MHIPFPPASVAAMWHTCGHKYFTGRPSGISNCVKLVCSVIGFSAFSVTIGLHTHPTLPCDCTDKIRMRRLRLHEATEQHSCLDEDTSRRSMILTTNFGCRINQRTMDCAHLMTELLVVSLTDQSSLTYSVTACLCAVDAKQHPHRQWAVGKWSSEQCPTFAKFGNRRSRLGALLPRKAESRGSVDETQVQQVM